MSSRDKDIWDKIEIAGKVALPVVLLLGGYFLNSQFNQRQHANELIGIAVGILSTPLSEEPDQTERAIRTWAVEILRNPTKGHTLSDEIAEKLKNEPLSSLVPPADLPFLSVVNLGLDENGDPIRGIVGYKGEIIHWKNHISLLPRPPGTPLEEAPRILILPLEAFP